MKFNYKEYPHRRLNILTGEWILVSPHRTKRPWQGKTESIQDENMPVYDEKCYLCPGNTRADGSINPVYPNSFTFVNDFSALLTDVPEEKENVADLLVTENQKGICKVIAFSPNHNLTLAQMDAHDIEKVVNTWQEEFLELSSIEYIKYIQIFENKGAIMGCSNPHPHGQVWAVSEVPNEIIKESACQASYYKRNGKSLLADYLEKELELDERIIAKNDAFVALVPFWATWPYETIIISRKHITDISLFSASEKKTLAALMQLLLIKYDNLFQTSFPYSSGMHQRPVNNGLHPEWHWHMHFYPPLLRSATVKKFMVGYEMLANAQRDITPESAAIQLKEISDIHYKKVMATH